jgi:hypothetical protein
LKSENSSGAIIAESSSVGGRHGSATKIGVRSDISVYDTSEYESLGHLASQTRDQPANSSVSPDNELLKVGEPDHQLRQLTNCLLRNTAVFVGDQISHTTPPTLIRKPLTLDRPIIFPTQR